MFLFISGNFSQEISQGKPSKLEVSILDSTLGHIFQFLCRKILKTISNLSSELVRKYFKCI